MKQIRRLPSGTMSGLLRGKSLARMLMNEYAGSFELRGDILDLGSKTEGPSYHKRIKWTGEHQVTYTDISADNEGVVMLDAEKEFPISDDHLDAVLCFNLLEHLYAAQMALKESCRVLKPGGVMIGAVPFLVRYHPDPHDYFRYTHEALERMALEAGFSSAEITPLGFGPLTAAASLFAIYLPAVLRAPLHLSIYALDRLFFRNRKIVEPLGYGFVFRK